MGTLEPSEDALSKLAGALDYPVSFFTRKPSIIGVSGGATFHRKQISLPARKRNAAHALAEARRLEVLTLMQSLDVCPVDLPEYPVELFDYDPAKIARSARMAMNLPPGPIFNLTETLERNGYVVVGHRLSRAQDGFSQRAVPYDWTSVALIHMNTDKPPDRWRWTLAHELGHIVMHTHEPTESTKDVEEQANLFASEFLMPAHTIVSYLEGLTFQKLGGLKREWKVSMQALIMRAHQLGPSARRNGEPCSSVCPRRGIEPASPLPWIRRWKRLP